jgi:hypothetical protein
VLPRVTPDDMWNSLEPSQRRISAPADVTSSPCAASQERASQERPGKRRRTDEVFESQADASVRISFLTRFSN